MQSSKSIDVLPRSLLLAVSTYISTDRRAQRPKLLGAGNKKGRRALHIAASSGNYQICSLLLRRNADVNATDESGNTALHAAAREKKWDIAELLLVKGASREKENAKITIPAAQTHIC